MKPVIGWTTVIGGTLITLIGVPYLRENPDSTFLAFVIIAYPFVTAIWISMWETDISNYKLEIVKREKELLYITPKIGEARARELLTEFADLGRVAFHVQEEVNRKSPAEVLSQTSVCDVSVETKRKRADAAVALAKKNFYTLVTLLNEYGFNFSRDMREHMSPEEVTTPIT